VKKPIETEVHLALAAASTMSKANDLLALADELEKKGMFLGNTDRTRAYKAAWKIRRQARAL